MDLGCACGRRRYRSLPTRCKFPFPSVTSRREPASGTRSSIGLFSFISQNWRGKPLISHAVIVKLIAATRTETGLKVKARLDTNSYPDGIKVSNTDLDNVKLRPNSFHGDWNYTIFPRTAVPAKT